MFTGIVQEVGSVYDVQKIGGGVKLTVEAPQSARQLSVNDSVSINGVCQTVVHKDGNRFSVIAVEETLRKTTLGDLKGAHRVNLELAMQLGDRLGGHLVSGHVDCVGHVESIEPLETSWLFKLLIPDEFERYVISVGSIAIDGVSLTVASIERNLVSTSIIPHTMENTVFSSYATKTRVNLEFDMIGKYVERLVRLGGVPTGQAISREQLKTWGYDV